eukprot:gnl/TRDRNA2_/TRDRNA2_166319_c0_seq1.p2 gnl/TRDRNA2_/TRDRNA2_166319_c0~~gnl/TRDRNA2_/TRDRNA2_166319_c0_seq1.p2  ORF type:complete len:102 (-),score=8.22 gnl/TRDRNA2_/TRDRNA2_166319_c0_seq1:111-416(-)
MCKFGGSAGLNSVECVFLPAPVAQWSRCKHPGGSVGHLYAGQTPWEDLTSTEKIVHLNIIARKNIGRRKQLGCSVEDMKEQTAGTALAYLMPWCEPFLRKA